MLFGILGMLFFAFNTIRAIQYNIVIAFIFGGLTLLMWSLAKSSYNELKEEEL
jgi:hypothetical protein